MKTKKGFTLIELLVSATIIAVVMAVGTATFVSASRRSRDTKRKADLEQIRSALEMYRADFNNYPSSAGGVASSVLGALTTNGYMAAIPNDPKTSPYANYYYSCPGSPCYLYCLSANIEGTDTVSQCTAPAGYDYKLKNP